MTASTNLFQANKVSSPVMNYLHIVHVKINGDTRDTFRSWYPWFNDYLNSEMVKEFSFGDGVPMTQFFQEYDTNLSIGDALSLTIAGNLA
ncbi:hypothetical protein HDV05_001280 [Chytridiales sp. JEL 0842]|nr:hypothetical protein HDV05_001280 [Chytridiales sp. JEL 0842]